MQSHNIKDLESFTEASNNLATRMLELFASSQADIVLKSPEAEFYKDLIMSYKLLESEYYEQDESLVATQIKVDLSDNTPQINRLAIFWELIQYTGLLISSNYLHSKSDKEVKISFVDHLDVNCLPAFVQFFSLALEELRTCDDETSFMRLMWHAHIEFIKLNTCLGIEDLENVEEFSNVIVIMHRALSEVQCLKSKLEPVMQENQDLDSGKKNPYFSDSEQSKLVSYIINSADYDSILGNAINLTDKTRSENIVKQENKINE